MRAPIIGSEFKRVDRKGKFIKQKCDWDGEYILVHNASTYKGHSGSPIVRINDEGRIEAVGLHTHSGAEEDTGEGLLMSVIRRKIIYFALELLKNHEMLEES
jgi:hypothetical protein